MNGIERARLISFVGSVVNSNLPGLSEERVGDKRKGISLLVEDNDEDLGVGTLGDENYDEGRRAHNCAQ